MPLFFLAIAAGFLTVLAPCILPLLPIILGTGTTGSKWRPVFVVFGFILSFSVIGAAFATAGEFLGISNNTARIIAVVLLVLFGLALIFEKVYQKITAKLSVILNRTSAKISGGVVGADQKRGNWSGILVGVSLGLIWVPCAGPILGTILTLAATDGNFTRTAVLFAAYSLGAGIPMLGIAYGSGWIYQKLQRASAHAHFLNKLFGILILLTAVAIYFNFDKVIQAYLVQFYPEGIIL